ncbi:MAG: flagella basal body P-ring formation protein FlgA [Rhodobacterales bacterium]|nr:MAG: flagella basal body P-ring formation protein FlgA [Rhodobacterales bacterium]
MLRLTLIATLLAGSAWADTVVPTRTIRAHSIIGPEDLALKRVDIAGTYSDMSELVGQEARVALYAGRPVRRGDIGPPALVERNQLISLIYSRGDLNIATEGRALQRAGVGDLVRVMNLSSRTTVSGIVMKDGRVSVSN